MALDERLFLKLLLLASAAVLAAGYSVGFAASFFATTSDYTDVHFCPEERCTEKIISLIDSSERSIDVAMLIFTHPAIADALVAAKNRGVRVRVLFDILWAASPLSVDDGLIASGIEVRYYSKPPEMHNKFMVIDDAVVATGSFDFDTTAAAVNDENIVIMKSLREARKYKEQFLALFEAGVAPGV